MYDHILSHIANEHEVKVIIVPPTYKNTTKVDLIIRYAKTFGIGEAAILSKNVIYYKIMNSLFGKKGREYYSLSAVLKEYNVPFTTENDLNSSECREKMKKWGTDLIVSLSCPQIFKKDLIELPPRGCLNLHGSLLPDYRGVMPSFWVLANNEKEAGITLFFVNEKIDGGDVIIQRKYNILPDDTLDSFIRHSKKIGAEMVVEAIEKINENNVETYPLDTDKGNYYGWPTKEDVLRFLGHGRRFR